MRENCESSGRFGATKIVLDRGPNSRGGRQTQTWWLCRKCEDVLMRGETGRAETQ